MTIDDLWLGFSFYMMAWIRPLKSGTIYSSSDPSDGSVQYSNHFGVRGNDLEFENKVQGGYWKTTSGDIKMDDWSYVEVRTNWDEEYSSGRLGFAINEAGVFAQFTFDFPVMDKDSYVTRLGALERDNTKVHHFKGFMSIFSVSQSYQAGNSSYLSVKADGGTCSCGDAVCLDASFNGNTVSCFSDCDALKYVDGSSVCQACPISCTKGCRANDCSGS